MLEFDEMVADLTACPMDMTLDNLTPEQDILDNIKPKRLTFVDDNEEEKVGHGRDLRTSTRKKVGSVMDAALHREKKLAFKKQMLGPLGLPCENLIQAAASEGFVRAIEVLPVEHHLNVHVPMRDDYDDTGTMLRVPEKKSMCGYSQSSAITDIAGRLGIGAEDSDSDHSHNLKPRQQVSEKAPSQITLGANPTLAAQNLLEIRFGAIYEELSNIKNGLTAVSDNVVVVDYSKVDALAVEMQAIKEASDLGQKFLDAKLSDLLTLNKKLLQERESLKHYVDVANLGIKHLKDIVEKEQKKTFQLAHEFDSFKSEFMRDK